MTGVDALEVAKIPPCRPDFADCKVVKNKYGGCLIVAHFAEAWSVSQRKNIALLQCVPDGDGILFLVYVKLNQMEHRYCRELITPT